MSGFTMPVCCALFACSQDAADAAAKIEQARDSALSRMRLEDDAHAAVRIMQLQIAANEARAASQGKPVANDDDAKEEDATDAKKSYCFCPTVRVPVWKNRNLAPVSKD